MLEMNALVLHIRDKRDQGFRHFTVGLCFFNHGADMAVHANQTQRLVSGGPEIGVPRLCQGDAELVGAFPRGQIGVPVDIDVGIDAHRDRRLDLHLLSDGGDHLQFFA